MTGAAITGPPVYPDRPIPGPLLATLTLARQYRRLVAYGAYAFASVLALGAAFLLRFEFQIPANYQAAIAILLLGLIPFRMLFARGFRVMTARWRFVGPDDLIRLAGASTLSSLCFLLLFRGVLRSPGIPLSVVAIEWALFNFGVGGIWLGYRSLFQMVRARYVGAPARARRVLIVGAGEAGNSLLTELSINPGKYRVEGFLDDDPLKKGTRIQGLEVLGDTATAPSLLRVQEVDEIIIAIPSATPEELRKILANLSPLEIPFRVLPGIASVLEGEVRSHQLRPLRIEDVLARDPVSLELPDLERDLRGRTVMVSGAAGSIGSELCRQVALHRPARLVLFDQAESELFFLDLELREKFPSVAIEAVIGDVLDEARVTEIFLRYKPDRIYHTAAYKHVPLMESNPREAVRNNVLGTWQIARLAGEHRLGRFVLISTDKAADPSNVMGATKRAAELVVRELQTAYPSTHYVAVRFGNVLGSNGSVIPVFQKQIASGGPITITHPDVTRFFMTIPEAVNLVLQAGLLQEARGKIAALEMGQPVRIVELARNLVRLSGLRPEVDIRFEYTGLRPGEKLHETLTGSDEQLLTTRLGNVSIIESSHSLLGVRLAAVLSQYHRERALTGAACLAWLTDFVLGRTRTSPPRPVPAAAPEEFLSTVSAP